jgi:glucose-6-phosphate isomerase
MTRPDTTPPWLALESLSREARGTSALAPLEAAGLYADFSRQSIDEPVVQSLLALADAMRVAERRDSMFDGGVVNASEGRPALHTALRAGPDCGAYVSGEKVSPFIQAQLDRMGRFADAFRSGRFRSIAERRFTDVVNIGIGGSLLGPAMACEALSRFADGPRMHFVSNVDGAHLAQTLKGLDPTTTFFTVTSKTFTTDETLANATSAQSWLRRHLGEEALAAHMAAITANPDEARRQRYADERIFEFRDWVGGRFSLWSPVGMPIALANGMSVFRQLLDGARAMDDHFRAAPFRENLPVMLALTGIWNRNFRGMRAHAILPYAQRLARLPAYLQQLEMESNGKSVDQTGLPVAYPTCPAIFGEAGTNGQHSFHQWLHQGTDLVSSDILLVAEPESASALHHEKLLANGLAQADALWIGHRSDLPYARHEGGRPVSLLVLPELNAFSLGALLALYEHKVFVQGAIWNIDSFDQWGVELGKSIARALLSPLQGREPGPPHLQTIIERLRRV